MADFRAVRALIGLPALAFCSILAGCSGASAPVPKADQSIPLGVPEIVLLLPAERSPEVELWDLTIQAAAGHSGKVVVTPLRPEKADTSPSRQVELAREAGQRGASAVIAVPGDPALLAPALRSLREQGVSVVVLGAEIPTEGMPFPRVSAPPLDQIADDLVKRSREVAKLQNLNPNGPATIIAPEPLGDGRIAPRVKALRGALERAGIPIATVITFRTGPENATKKFEASRSDPNPSTLVFGVEDYSLLDAAGVRQDRMGRDNFIVAGFADQQDISPSLNSGAINVAAIGSYREQALQAFDLAASLVSGETPEVVIREVATPIRVSIKKPVQRVYTYGTRGLEPAVPISPEGEAAIATPHAHEK